MNEDRTSGSGDSMGRGRDLSRSRDLLGSRSRSTSQQPEGSHLQAEERIPLLGQEESTQSVSGYVKALCAPIIRMCFPGGTTSDNPSSPVSPTSPFQRLVEEPGPIPEPTHLGENRSPVDFHLTLPGASAAPVGRSTSEGAALETNKQMEASFPTMTSTGIESYNDFKIKYVSEGIEYTKLIEFMRNEYSRDDRSFMLKAHLKEIYDRRDVFEPISESDRSLQKAFVVVRGKDFYDKIQKIQPLSEEEAARIREEYDKRYVTTHDAIKDEINTIVKGHKESCYKNVIDLPEGKISFYSNFKKAPDETEPDTLLLESYSRSNSVVYDNQKEPIQADGQPIEGTKPLALSKIIWAQVEYMAEKTGGFDLSNFKPTLDGLGIVNRETVRTMRLFIQDDQEGTFVLGQDQYFAALGTPVCKGKCYLIAERLPKLEITEITMSIDDSKEFGIAYTEYKLDDKVKRDNKMVEQV